MNENTDHKTLCLLLMLFDRKVLTNLDEKCHFRGGIFEYELECDAENEHELIQKIGDFLMEVPKYMWNLKIQETKTKEN